ncbi:MAG: 2-C-methyl-D-erythritol 2,4-cyclodiphosphate synthase [Armatimonadota bacterium]|nr:2-C-methyl-D-erythritol 2,4-cyclodiphosphate synthase [Armatimonadota bacterium]MDR5696700.1 2-C-methyl-D-erythritol 2,4-cyclodiphosphate synthase [Armatimonadota bacterium]
MRVGLGLDLHRFAQGRTLRLGGVEIPYERGLAGHSDADVLLHAVMDAALGAAGLGDIGAHFPPDDDRYRDADSAALLRGVRDRLGEMGWAVVQVDAVVVAEAPRLSPYVERMRARIAEILDLPVADVAVKATTAEGMGAIGRGEGIQAIAVVLLERV